MSRDMSELRLLLADIADMYYVYETKIAELEQQVASLEGERDRLRAALEAIADDDVEEWEMKLVAMKSLEKIDND